MVQNGSPTSGKNSSSTYAESENQHTITVYQQIYTYIGLNNYYNRNTVAANVLLSVILVVLILILGTIVYVFLFKSHNIKTSGSSSSMIGGNRNYYNVVKTPQIVRDMYN